MVVWRLVICYWVYYLNLVFLFVIIAVCILTCVM